MPGIASRRVDAFWRRRFWSTFPAVFIAPIAIALPIALPTQAPHIGFSAGIALGAGAGAAMVLFDSPPAHIERWRTESKHLAGEVKVEAG